MRCLFKSRQAASRQVQIELSLLPGPTCVGLVARCQPWARYAHHTTRSICPSLPCHGITDQAVGYIGHARLPSDGREQPSLDVEPKRGIVGRGRLCLLRACSLHCACCVRLQSVSSVGVRCSRKTISFTYPQACSVGTRDPRSPLDDRYLGTLLWRQKRHIAQAGVWRSSSVTHSQHSGKESFLKLTSDSQGWRSYWQQPAT